MSVTDYAMTCHTCGRIGNEDDGIEIGGPCQEPCPGTVVAANPTLTLLSDIAPGEWFTDMDGERWMKTDYHADRTLCVTADGEHGWHSPDGVFAAGVTR